MARLCTICTSKRRREIDAAVLEHAAGFRAIAARFDVAPSSLKRHAEHHLRAAILAHREALMLKDSESLVEELNWLHEHARQVIERAVQAGDDKLVLAGIREGRNNVDILSKVGPLAELEARITTLETGGTHAAADTERAAPSGE